MSSPGAAAFVRTACEEERERKQQAEAEVCTSMPFLENAFSAP